LKELKEQNEMLLKHEAKEKERLKIRALIMPPKRRTMLSNSNQQSESKRLVIAEREVYLKPNLGLFTYYDDTLFENPSLPKMVEDDKSFKKLF
jgi:hypothetical protein